MKGYMFQAKAPLEVGDEVLYLTGSSVAPRLSAHKVVDILAIHSAATGQVWFEYRLEDVLYPVPIEQIVARVVDNKAIELTDTVTASQEVTHGTCAGS